MLYVNKNKLMMLIENVQNAFNQRTDKKKFHSKNCEIYNSKNFMMEDYLINMEKKEPHKQNRKTSVKQFSNEFRYKHRRSQTDKKTGMSKVSSHGKHTLDMIK